MEPTWKVRKKAQIKAFGLFASLEPSSQARDIQATLFKLAGEVAFEPCKRKHYYL